VNGSKGGLPGGISGGVVFVVGLALVMTMCCMCWRNAAAL